MTKWKYGNAWESFPIEQGETWGLPLNNSRVSVHNIFDPLPYFMYFADLLFIDPPWNKGNLTGFYTKAGRNDYIQEFSEFENILFQRITEINPVACYLEVGFQAVDKWAMKLKKLYQHVQRWDVTYYHKHPCHILRGSHIEKIDFDYTGMDEEKVIYKAAEIESYNVIGDMCMGLGLVGLAAFKAGKPFVGTELNNRRLANLLKKISKKGGVVQKYERGIHDIQNKPPITHS